MDEEKINLQKYAMRYGTYMGLFWIVKFFFFPAGLTSPLLMFLFLMATLAVPFVGYAMARSFRNNYCGGGIRFAQAWVFTTFLFMFAGLLTAIAHYIYFAFLDQGYLVNTYSSLMQEVESMDLTGMEGYLEQMEQVLESVRNLSPIQMVIQLLSQNVIYGSILALPIAFFVKREKPAA